MTPRQSLIKENDRDREDLLRTPTQSQQSVLGNLPSSGSGIISSSLGFLTSITVLDKLPSVFSGLSSFTAKDEYPRGEDGQLADLTEDRDLRIEDATGDDEFYSDSPVVSKTEIQNGLDDAAVPSPNSIDYFQPEAVARVGTSTTLESSGGSSSRVGLSPFPSNLTYASTSSLSLHETDNGSSTRSPTASHPKSNSESHSSILDPVTYQSLRRKNSEADAKRVERERQDRTRQLDLLDRLQEQAENPHLKHVEMQNQILSKQSIDTRPRSPLVPQRESKFAAIGLGSPPVPDSTSNGHPAIDGTPEVKKT